MTLIGKAFIGIILSTIATMVFALDCTATKTCLCDAKHYSAGNNTKRCRGSLSNYSTKLRCGGSGLTYTFICEQISITYHWDLKGQYDAQKDRSIYQAWNNVEYKVPQNGELICNGGAGNTHHDIRTGKVKACYGQPFRSSIIKRTPSGKTARYATLKCFPRNANLCDIHAGGTVNMSKHYSQHQCNDKPRALTLNLYTCTAKEKVIYVWSSDLDR